MQIEQIAPQLAWNIRQQAMYPDKPGESFILADDENGVHFGLFDNNTLISVVSWFKQSENKAQFRKFATLGEFRNLGYGTRLLQHIIDFSNRENIKTLWCNARVNAFRFYERSGFRKTGTSFTKDGIEYIIIQLELH